MATHYTKPQITITAGMDYDEYAGIEAAHILQKKYTGHKDITVIPLDYSPIDGKVPKLVFPGKANGTDTERRMHLLYETYIKDADLWIDLHGGATHEELTPFIWLYQSKHPKIQRTHQQFIQNTSASIIVYDKHPFMNYSKFLDSKGIAHILMECGDQGKRRKKDITTLVTWVEECINAPKRHVTPAIYTSVRYIFNATENTNGQLLWRSTDPYYKKGNLYAAYGLP